jgi:hypothetical protein
MNHMYRLRTGARASFSFHLSTPGFMCCMRQNFSSLYGVRSGGGRKRRTPQSPVLRPSHSRKERQSSVLRPSHSREARVPAVPPLDIQRDFVKLERRTYIINQYSRHLPIRRVAEAGCSRLELGVLFDPVEYMGLVKD